MRSIFTLLVLTVLIACTVIAQQEDKSYHVKRIESQLHISESGCEVTVSERITYLFHGQYTVVGRMIPKTTYYGDAQVRDIKVQSRDVSVKSVDGVLDDEKNYNILWRFEGLKVDDLKEVTFDVSFKIVGILQRAKKLQMNMVWTYPWDSTIDDLDLEISFPQDTRVIKVTPEHDAHISAGHIHVQKKAISKGDDYTVSIVLNEAKEPWKMCQLLDKRITFIDSVLKVDQKSCMTMVTETIQYSFKGSHSLLRRQIPKRITFGAASVPQVKFTTDGHADVTRYNIRELNNATFIEWEFTGIESGENTAKFTLEYHVVGVVKYVDSKNTLLSWSYQVLDETIDAARTTVLLPFISNPQDIRVSPESEATVTKGQVVFNKKTVSDSNFDIVITMPSKYGGVEWSRCTSVPAKKRNRAMIIGVSVALSILGLCCLGGMIALISRLFGRTYTKEYEQINAPTVRYQATTA